MSEHVWDEVMSIGRDAIHWCKWCGVVRHNYNGKHTYYIPGPWQSTPNSQECLGYEPLRASVADLAASHGRLLAACRHVIHCFDAPGVAWSASRDVVKAAIAAAPKEGQ